MYIRVEFTNTMMQDFIMDGPRVDYVIRDGFLVITTNSNTNTPEKKKVTFPIREVHAIFEYHNEE